MILAVIYDDKTFHHERGGYAMIVVKVNPGICGFPTVIKLNGKNRHTVEVLMQTECPNLQPMSEELKEVDAFKECFAKVGESPVFQLARRHCKHAACPVPTAILKGVEAAAKLALPKNVEIEIRAED